MIGAMFVNNGSNVDAYEVIVDTSKIKRIQKCIDNYYGKGEKLEKQTNSLDLICGHDFTGKKVEIISKKFLGKEHIVDNRYPRYEGYVKIYKYKYYSYKQHELSRLCDRLLDFNGTVDLSCNIKNIFGYKCQTSEEYNFLKDIITAIKIRKIDKKTFLIRLKNIINGISSQNQNIEINFDNEINNIMNRAQRFNKTLYHTDLNEDIYKRNLSLGLTTKNKILMLLPTIETMDEKLNKKS